MAIRCRARGHHPGAPGEGSDLDAEVARAVEIARAVPGVGEVRAYSKEESAGLLEPWLGSGLSLEDLPVPRMIVVKLPSGGVDLAPLRKALSEQVAGASLDDHRAWIDRMRTMAQTTIAGGIGLLDPDAGGDGAVGDLRHARRDGDQSPDRRGAAFHRRQERLHRRPVPAPLPHAGAGGRPDRRRVRDAAVRRGRHRREHGAPARRAAIRSPRCSAASRSAGAATSRSSRRSCWSPWSRRSRRGGRSTAPWKRSSSAVPSGRRILRYHPAGDRH